jgi:hypothetical protein
MFEKLKGWFKKDQPEITFWSEVPGLEEVVPVQPAVKYLPEWWKKMPRFADVEVPPDSINKGTAKNCPAFVDFFKSAYVVPLWCDIELNITPEGYTVRTSHDKFNFSHHNPIQFKQWLPAHLQQQVAMVLKPACPWRVKTNPGYSVMQLPMMFEFSNIFETLPGTIWSDKFHEMNQQMIIKRYGKVELERGTPLAMYVPFKRDKFDFNCTHQTPELERLQHKSQMLVRSKFIGGYKSMMKDND